MSRIPLPEQPPGAHVLRGAAADWPAVRTWTPRHLASLHGDQKVGAHVDLPRDGVPYERWAEDHAAELSFSAVVRRIEDPAAGPSYLDQHWLARLPGLGRDLQFERLLPAGSPPPRHVNLWMGSAGTDSGLHFDLSDNLLVQVHGRKRVWLVEPRSPRLVYPFPDQVMKSRVNAACPDLARFPRFAETTVMEAELHPGDVLFVPRLVWHQLVALEPAISVNLWHNDPVRATAAFGILVRCGPAAWACAARDLVRHGLLRRPWRRRLFSPAPTGLMLWDAMGLRAR